MVKSIYKYKPETLKAILWDGTPEAAKDIIDLVAHSDIFVCTYENGELYLSLREYEGNENYKHRVNRNHWCVSIGSTDDNRNVFFDKDPERLSGWI
jgi:hypothetical protein